jgi:RNA-binding protein YlmH
MSVKEKMALLHVVVSIGVLKMRKKHLNIQQEKLREFYAWRQMKFLKIAKQPKGQKVHTHQKLAPYVLGKEKLLAVIIGDMLINKNSNQSILNHKIMWEF